MLRFMGRMLLIPIAFALAAIAAAATILVLGYELLAEASAIEGGNVENIIEGWIGFAFEAVHLTAYLSTITLLPGILLVLIGEAVSIRSSIYYILGAGIALAAMPLLTDLSAGNQISDTAMELWPKFATAGFAGGLVYWILAGRNA